MNKILTLVLAILLLAALFINGGCGSSSTVSNNKSTSLVSVVIGNNGKSVSLAIQPVTLLARAELLLRRAWHAGRAIAAGIPADVKNINITVSAPDMATINRGIQILGQLEITDSFEVPNGAGRLFRVNALNTGGKSIYSAEASRDLNGEPVDISFDMKPYTVNVTPVDGANGSITPSTIQTFIGGSTAQFTITPNTNYSIVIPMGGTCPQGSLVGTSYTTGPVTEDCTVAPNFELIPIAVTPIAGTNGSISPSTQQMLVGGTSAQFTITPNSGYHIATPVGGTCPQGTFVGTTYTTGAITSNCTVAPTFISDFLTVSPVTSANGSISPSTSQPVLLGSTTQFTITPNSGYHIATPVGGTCPQGSLVGTTYTTGEITSNCTVEPTFISDILTVFPVTRPNGSISPATPQPVLLGSTTQFTITPDTYYSIVTPVGGTCPQGTLDGNTYTTGIITNNCSVAPTFIRDLIVTPSIISNLIESSANISPSTPQMVKPGTTIQFIISTNDGFSAIVTPVGGTCPQGSLVGPNFNTNLPGSLDYYYTYTTGQITNDCIVEPTIGDFCDINPTDSSCF